MIEIINDSEMEKIEIDDQKFYTFDITNKKNYSKEIIITPHFRENYGNIGFMKLKLYCEKNNIKVTSFGLLNQLPLFSIFSDAVILHDKPRALANIYQGPSVAGANLRNMKYFIDLYGAQYENIAYMKCGEYVDLMNGGPKAPDPTRCPLLTKACGLKDEEVIERFYEQPVYLRQSTIDFFDKLELPEDIIMCEIKADRNGASQASKIFINWIEENRQNIKLPLMGIYNDDQKKLVEKCDNHYIGVQILASLKKNWFFMCYGGSSNLFSLLPTKTLLLYDHWLNSNLSTERVVKGIYNKRYGVNTIPIFPRRVRYVKKILDENINEINNFLDYVSAVPTFSGEAVDLSMHGRETKDRGEYWPQRPKREAGQKAIHDDGLDFNLVSG